MRPSRLCVALRRKRTSASVRSCGICRHERRATKSRGRWGKSKRCERAQRNMRAHPGEVRVVELAILRGAPSLAVRLVGLAGELCIKLALLLPRLALLRGRFFKRRSRCSLFFGPARGFSCCVLVLACLPRCSPARGFSRCVLVLACLLRCSPAGERLEARRRGGVADTSNRRIGSARGPSSRDSCKARSIVNSYTFNQLIQSVLSFNAQYIQQYC